MPGENLSAVVIPKLPFTPPHDPVTDSLAEAEQVSSFSEFSLPAMILRLRQGIGRLIRTVDDRGAIVIVDSRFLHQQYGKHVLDSLPPATVHIGSFEDLIPRLTDWFGDDLLATWQADLNQP